MKRIPLKDRTLPRYTRGEEIFNMVSHIVGGAFGVGALLACILTAAWHNNVWGIASGAFYGISMIAVYTISSVYHGLKPATAKKVMQIIDHCDIYFLIAGSETPIFLTHLREHSPIWAWSLFAVAMAGTAFGVTFKAIDLHRYRAMTMACYFVMGWGTLFAIKPLLGAYPLRFFIWIFAGGAVYTLGMIFFSLGRRIPYLHAVFHLFILGGSVIQFFGILFYCMR